MLQLPAWHVQDLTTTVHFKEPDIFEINQDQIYYLLSQPIHLLCKRKLKHCQCGKVPENVVKKQEIAETTH